MSHLIESDIENYAINLFETLGYRYFHGEQLDRERLDEVVLIKQLNEAVNRINPGLPESSKQQAIQSILRIHSPDVLANNETLHRALTEGVKVSKIENNQERGDLVWLIDFEQPDNNEFLVVNQFTVIENHYHKRPDKLEPTNSHVLE
jgi:type I restriction enzyme R subunit